MEKRESLDMLRRHAGLIGKVALAYARDAADRDEIAQEIAIQLWRSAERFDPRFKESTWVYRIALNVAISCERRERRHRLAREPLDLHAASLSSPPDAEPSDDVLLLLGCIAELGALEKALVLLYLDGNDHAAISNVLGISVTNVGTKLGRIKAKLRVAIERRARSQAMETHHDRR